MNSIWADTGDCGFVAQRIACAPQRPVAGEANTARCLFVICRKADGVFVALLNPIAGFITAVAQNAVVRRHVKQREVSSTLKPATLGDNHAPLGGEQDI